MNRRFAVLMVAALAFPPAALNAGALNGPQGGRNERVSAYCTKVYPVTFRGSETAAVILAGDGDTDLDLYVYDAAGNLIEYDDDDTDDCLVQWTPRRTGTFYLKVVNRGGVFNVFSIATN